MYTSTPIFYNTHLQLALFGQHGPMTKKRRKVSHLMSWKWHAMPLFLPLWCGSAHPICMFFPTPYLLSYIHLLTLGISSLSPYKSKVKSPMLQRKEDYSSSRSFHFFFTSACHELLHWKPYNMHSCISISLQFPCSLMLVWAWRLVSTLFLFSVPLPFKLTHSLRGQRVCV